MSQIIAQPAKRLKNPKLASANLIAFIVAACGGGGGGGSSAPTPVIPSNSSPNAGVDTTISLLEDVTAGALNLSAPTDSDGDSLSISVTSIPTSGTLNKADGSLISNGDTLTSTELEGLTFTPEANTNGTDFGSFSYSVSDGNGATDSRTINFSVDAVNDAPDVGVVITELAPEENTTELTTFTATDIDGDTLTYSISGGADQALFQIDSATGVLTFISAPDYENPLDEDTDNVYDVQVSAADPSGASTSVSYVITVNNVSEPETVTGTVVDGYVSGATVKLLDADGNVLATTTTDANGQYTLEATESIGTRIVVDGGTDSFTGEGITVTLSGSKDSDYISGLTTLIDSTDAESESLVINLGLPENFDYKKDDPIENLEVQKVNAQIINVLSVGEALLEILGIEDNLGDELVVNQIIETIKAGKSLTNIADITEIFQNSAKETVAEVSISTVVDQISETLAYVNQTVNESVDVIEIASIQKIVVDDEDSVIKDLADAITNNTTYNASTKEELVLKASAAATVNQKPISLLLSASTITENLKSASIGELTATDLDTRETFIYEISGQDKDYFEIIEGNLKLLDNYSSNFETKSSYSIQITAIDSGGEEIAKSFNISVEDVNEAPTSVKLSSYIFQENSLGSDIGTVSSEDEDSDETFTYGLSGEDKDFFELSGNILKLKDSSVADYETKSSYAITMTTTDAGGLSKAQDITINVTDVNETPTDIDLSATAVEENIAGVTVATISTTDPDADDTFTYTLSGDDADNFEVLGSSLKFKDTLSPNFENKSSYEVTLTATDSGELTYEEAFTINITDVNEAPSAISLDNLFIEQGTDGVLVDIVVVTDEDADDTYTLELSGTDADQFEIVDNKLKLKEGISANWETKPSYNLSIKAIDTAGATFVKAVQVKVIEPPFAPEFQTASRVTMSEDIKLVLNVAATDKNGDSITYSISGGLDQSQFIINETSGELSFASTPDFEAPTDSDSNGVYEVTVRSSDGSLNTDQAITVTVVKTFIEGTALQDTLSGTSGNDYFKGNGGIDSVDGGAGTDRLIIDIDSSNFFYVENKGITIIYTNDEYSPYTEVKVINIEEIEFPDLLWNPPTSAANFILGGWGVDTDLLGTNSDDVFDPSTGWKRLVGYEGQDTVVIWENSDKFQILTRYGVTKLIASSEAGNYANDVITFMGIEKISFLDQDIEIDTTDYGSLMYTYDADTIVGDENQNIYDIAGGDDIIDGNEGNDYVLIFAKATDFVYETIYGVTKLYGLGTSPIYGYDVITLTDVEYVEFVADGDFQFAPEVKDYNSAIYSLGPEIIEGGSTQDVIDPGGGSDVIDGKGGDDYVILFDNSSKFDVVTIYGITKIIGKADANFLYSNEVLTLSNVEFVKFSDKQIVLDTSSEYSITTGGYGNDYLTGSSSDDYFDGISGDDSFNGGSGNDHLVIFANGENFTYTTQGSIAKLYGNENAGIYANSVLTLKNVEFVNFLDFEWTVPYEEIDGTVITGTFWSDKLEGTSGNDFFDPVAGDDYIDGKGGDDVIWVFSNISNFWYSEVDGITRLTGTADAGDYAYNVITIVDVDKVDFLDSTWNVPQADSDKNIILGSWGSDLINGSAEDDVIDPSGGDDYIDGAAGDDHVVIWKDFYTYDSEGEITGNLFYLEELAGIIKIWGFSGSGDYAGDLITLTNIEKVTFKYSETEIYNTTDTTEKTYILGTPYSENLLGTSENEYFDSAGSSDFIRGYGGEDTALFFLNADNFNIQTLSGVTRIVAKEDTYEYEGSTTYLFEIEKVMFSDQTITIDTTIPNGLVLGSPASNLLEGNEEDNIFDPWYGSDVIKGNGGTDSVIIFSDRQYFDISTNEQGVTYLTGLSGSGDYYGSTMELNEISKIVFLDQEVSLISYQVISSIESTYIDEGTSTTLSLRLSAEPTGEVTVSFSSNDRLNFTDGSTSVSSYTFNSTNWNITKEINVTAVDDTEINSSNSADISFSVDTSDNNFKDSAPSVVSISIKDGESPLHSISGKIWNDENENGTKDDNENYQEGWTVYLDQNQNRSRDENEIATKTDANGNYVFNDLEAGTYFVGVDLPLGWGQSKPATASTKTVSVGISEGTGSAGTTQELNDSTYHANYQKVAGITDFQNSDSFGKFDGSGSAIVILDTGIDLDHSHFGPDGDGDGVADRIVYQYDFYNNDNNASDYQGHGTHVTGTAAGSDKQFPGVAPGADIIHLKVFPDSEDDGGAPQYAILNALKWVLENAEEYNIVAVNLSLGSPFYNTQAYKGYASELFEALANKGVIVVAASGNSYGDGAVKKLFDAYGMTDESAAINPTNMLGNQWDSLGVGYPSSDPWAMSIGSTYHSDTGYHENVSELGFKTGEDVISAYSNRDDDLTVLFAPGTLIPAAWWDGSVKSISGTSMASPVVAGAVVVIQQIAETLFGQRLTFNEMINLLQTYGDQIIDGDDEDDGLYHSGDSYSRLDILKVAEALITLAGPGQYSTTLNSGNDATNLDFGVTELDSGAPGDTGILVGTYFSDRLDGSSKADKIYGGSGNDEIYGKEGVDSLFGGDGNDILEGGPGIDTLVGGKGRDAFNFTDLTDLGDSITDFEGGSEGDVIGVKALLSSLGYNSNDAFVDGWLSIEQSGSDTLIKLDKDGGGDNFDTLIATLKNFTLSDFERENTDTNSTIWVSNNAQSSSVTSLNLDASSLDIDLSGIKQLPSEGINTGFEDISLDGLIDLEIGDKIEFNNEELFEPWVEDPAKTNPTIPQIEEPISRFIDDRYEEDILFVSLEI